MKKTIIFLLFIFCTVFSYAQTEGTFYILKPQKNRNTGKLLTSMYVQVKEHKQMGTVAVLSTKKGEMGIPFKLDKVSTEKAKKQIFAFTRSFFVEYDGNSFMSFDILGTTPDGKLKIANPNYYAKDKDALKSIMDAKIEAYAQEIYNLTK